MLMFGIIFLSNQMMKGQHTVINFIKNLDFSVILASVITAAFSFYTFRKTKNYEYTIKRYENLIFPLFDLMEPFLFMPLRPKALAKALELIEKNKPLAGELILSAYRACKANPCQDSYNRFCEAVSKEYDCCCTDLGIPKRSFKYRFKRKQYRSPIVFTAYMLFYLMVRASILASFLIILLFCLNVIGNIIGNQ